MKNLFRFFIFIILCFGFYCGVDASGSGTLYNSTGDIVSYHNGLLCFNYLCYPTSLNGELSVRTFDNGPVVFISTNQPATSSYEVSGLSLHICLSASYLQYAFTKSDGYIYDSVSQMYQKFVKYPEFGCPILGSYDGTPVQNPGLVFSTNIQSTENWFSSPFGYSLAPTPSNLTQSIEMPDPENSEGDTGIIDYKLKREEIGLGKDLGYKIGHFQSGSGIILTATVNNLTSNTIQLVFTVTGTGTGTNSNYNQSFTGTEFTTGTGEITVPDLPAGDYTWKVKTIGTGFTDSVEVSHTQTGGSDTDFAIFEGFEPYPYGYKFENRSPSKYKCPIVGNAIECLTSSTLLDGGISGGTSFPFIPRVKVPGYKWEIFKKAFNTSMYNEFDNKMFDTFEAQGLNSSEAFQGGSCYGMALSVALKYKDSSFLNDNYSSFVSKIGSGNIWSKIEKPSINNYYEWNEYTNTLETIFALQLSQHSLNQESKRLDYTGALNAFNQIKNNPDKTYMLNFWGTDKDFPIEKRTLGHAVIPYKVEEFNNRKKIYFWDNNVPYPRTLINNLFKKAYEQYIEIYSNGTWKAPLYSNWESYDKLSLVEVEDLVNGEKSLPSGFNGFDLAYTLSGISDIYLEDNLGRVTGYKDGGILEEIPGVKILSNLGVTLSGSINENTWKQLYLPQKMDGLTLHIDGTTNEKYTLMIAGGDHYQKLEGVSTSTGQTDTFITTGTGLTINFDDTKTGTYSLLVDNFHDYGVGNNGTGTVYIESANVIPQPNEYVIDWNKVVTNNTGALTYQIDTNNDGIIGNTGDTTTSTMPIINGTTLNEPPTQPPVPSTPTYTFPMQTIPYNSGQQTAISSWYTVVGNVPGYTWGQNIPFTTAGLGNPTVQTTNGNRTTSGIFQGGINIEMNVPPRGETYTGYVDIQGIRLEFTTKRDLAPPSDVGTLDFGTQTVNYNGTVVSNWYTFPFLPDPTTFSLSGSGNPTVQTSNGTRSTTGTVSYGTNIQAEIPAIGQTRVIEFTILGKTGRFTIKRQ